ncbi:hypothetical protein PTTG_09010 [Puccinia triticina 1-1 BBBD Race 1]|uniref:AAA domain-containing protein n=1 Tax=Puccinia triticina (isolate 1-1 / race 1 (BBBD)) TaxID=630390 RepID=A0A180GSC2_PUCT1|nr:hypothetical protein PTTG_09010 [Puccinia triticina 1-1 BBBD Race 1]
MLVTADKGWVLTIADRLLLSRSFPHGSSTRTFYNQSVPHSQVPFYNRQETESLTRLLKGHPALTLMLGPPNCGKTALTRHVTSQLRADGSREFQPLTVDLRSVDTTETGSFLEAFLRAGTQKAMYEVDSMYPCAKAAAQVFAQLGNGLKEVKEVYPSERPVIVIDEAHYFKRMNDKAIDAFLDFAVRHTVQEAQMHVIFTSSDPLFQDWLARRINHINFSTLVLGDLSRQEAHDYFLQVVKAHPQLSEEKKNLLSSLDFDIPFKMTGGRMFFIRKYVDQVHVFGYFDDPMDFEPVSNAYNAMLGSSETAATTFKILINSPGYISHCELVKKIGSSVVKEMIERNLIHHRPKSNFSRDLIPSPTEPVVTAQSQPALRAMEALLISKFGYID